MKLLKDPVTRGWIAASLLLAIALALAVPFLVGADDRHLTAYRDGDEDASLALDQLVGRAASVDAILSTPHQLGDIRDPTRTLLVVLGSERRYTESEADAVVDFVRRGGHAILADEGGYGTDIARHAGFGFSDRDLLDTRNHGGDHSLVVATATTERGGQTYTILLNGPTAIMPLQNANAHDVLARSSPSAYPDGSFLDTNDNGVIERTDGTSGESEGFALIVRTSIGDNGGTLVLVADTGAFMNAQLEQSAYQNGAYLGALVGSIVPGDGVVLLDEARHAPAPALSAYDNAVRVVGQATSGPLAPLVTLSVVVLATIALWWATRETEDWSHHAHDIGRDVPVPADVRPDLERAQRMARRRISERFNIPLEQVAAMPADQLQSLTGDKMLAEAAAGTLRSDPAPLFRTFSTPEATP